MEKETMTPSNMEPMTNGQIAKITDVVAAKLRKAEFASKPAQDVLGNPDAIGDMADMFISAFRRHIDLAANSFSEVIIRHAQVDISRTPQEILDATNRRQSTRGDVVANIPRGEGGKRVVYLIPLRVLLDTYENKTISDDELEKFLNEIGYKSADPYTLTAVNENDPSLADKYVNCTHWKGKNGKWYFINFGRENKGDFDVGLHYPDFWAASWEYFFAVEKIEE